MKPVLVEGLVAGYGGELILRGVSLTVEEREIHVILGPSGCGKSTLLNNILGFERPRGGRVEVLGEPVFPAAGGFPPELRRRTGVLFQNSALLSSLTVEENVALPLTVHHPELPAAIAGELARAKLAEVGLVQAAGKYPAELSGGMRKRAALARALVTDPELLFCDEPSAGLDPVTSRGLDDLLLEVRDRLGLAIVIVTHELDSIRRICDRLTFLAGGNAIFQGTLADAGQNGPPQVRDFFARAAAVREETVGPAAFHFED